MKTVGRAAIRFQPRLILGWLTLLGAAILPLAAQPVVPTSAAASAITPASSQNVVQLDGPWRLQVGDDLNWADPSFDDSKWASVALSQPLANQDLESFAGNAWYRLRITPAPASLPLDLLVTNGAAGELAVYVNGVESGHTRGMTNHPASYWTHPFVVHLEHPAADGSFTLAIRGWSGDSTATSGPLSMVILGPPLSIRDQLELANSRLWFKYVLAILLGILIYVCVAFLGGVLYLTQRHHPEYLWLTLICVSLLLRGVIEIGGLTALFSTPSAQIFDKWAASVFMAVTLEFVLRFTASNFVKQVRVLQIAALLIPIASVLHFEQPFNYLSIATQIAFGLLVVVMLLGSWRRGRPEAGVVLFPFLLAVTGNFIATLVNYAAGNNWIPARYAIDRFSIGPVQFGLGFFTYQIFIASLVAVILYRFIRVSQDEQRSNAEIAAARSVQALLIPTQLPSNSRFMLESAYLPVNGVGGDFFQVLPLKDDSLLIVVGDVSGKGLQAAMNSSTLVGALRNELSHDPATVLEHLNHVLLGAVSVPGAVPELDAAPCFATCLCARIYPDGTLTVANAGHLSPYRDGRELPLPPGLPLGVIAGNQYEQASFHLNRGDRLVFLSDGVVEAQNSDGELFGFERTQQVSNESARYIAQTAKHFGQTDDITVVSLYVASRAAERESEPVGQAD